MRRLLLSGAAVGFAGLAVVQGQAASAPASTNVADGLLGAIGNTPLIELKSLSKATGCRILAKAENLNPGGSVKDRAAKWLILDAERRNVLKRGTGQCIIEATGGNTGIGIALVGTSLGYRCLFTLPSSISESKQDVMRLFGAQIQLQPLVPFDNPNHFYHVAKALAKTMPNSVCLDQFENLANSQAHYDSTAPEVWAQTGGRIDGFVCAAGTGGTMGGMSQFFKERRAGVQCYLIDPPGSGLFAFVTTGTFVALPGAAVTEGIGIMRKTANFARGSVDGAFAGTNQEALDMTFFLLANEGLYVGPSAGLNVAGAVKLARKLGPGHTIVTILCDTGDRYATTIFKKGWLQERGLTISPAALARCASENDVADLSFVL